MNQNCESSYECLEQDLEHPVDFKWFGKDYDEEKKETSQHQEVFNVHKQAYITEEDEEYPAKK